MSDAILALQSADQFPYADDEDTFERPTWQRRAANAVIADLRGRGGIGNELDGVDEDIRTEIVDALEDIIRLAHEQRERP